MRFTFVAVVLVLGSHTNAQGWSITAYAPVQGNATASASGSSSIPSLVTNSATLPIGPAQLGTLLQCSASHPSGAAGVVTLRCDWGVSGSSAPLQFTASSSSSSSGNYFWNASGTAFGNAQIVLTLRAPQPVGGRLWVRVLGSDTATQAASSSSRIDLDVNADGTIEVSAQPGAATTPLDLPLQIPATGAVIKLTYSSNSFAGAGNTVTSANGSRTIEAQFFPGEPAVAPFATFSGAATMSVDHGFSGAVTLSIAGAGLTPVLMVFGGTPISVPLWPYVTVLVSPDVLIGTTGSITLQLPPLPPGALYAQGLVLDSVGTLRGTNSVRFLWL